MLPVRVDNLDQGVSLGNRIRLADRWWLRIRGLLGRPPLEPGEGILLLPCQGIHTVGMRAPLDVLFLTRDGRVTAVYENLPPASRTRWHRNAHCALEVPAGTAQRTGTTQGDRLIWRPVSDRVEN
jgi:hypothetical protein